MNELYKKVTSNTIGLSTNRSVVVNMLWQPYLAYENESTYKMLLTDGDADLSNDSFFAKLNRAYREMTAEEKANGDRDQWLIRMNSKVAGKDLTDFYEAHGIVANETTLQYVSQFPKETKKIQYINDEARRRRMAGTADMEEGTILSAKFGNDSRGNEIVNGSYVNDKNVSINLSVDKSNDNILGYEIYRNGKPAGFIERNKNGQETVYTDVVDNINNRVVTYSAVAYDYNLNPTNTVELGTIKVRHEGGIAKSSTILTTNTISLNENHNDIHGLPEKVCFQLNDTHPTVTVPELMRILLDEYGLEWDDAWDITTRTCAYTNHTIMAEALEKWPLELFSRLLPRIYQITEEINRRFQNEIQAKYPDNQDKVKSMAIIYDGQVKMAHLAIAAGFSVNGVARLHTEILKHQELKDFYEMMPEKFNNKTNGITQRRFLLHGNPKLAAWVTDKIGDEWITDLSKIDKLSVFVDDKKAQQEFMNIKFQNKVRLAKYIKEHNGVEVDPHSIFDVQVKRLHEYKRQLLNILHVMYLYNQLKKNPGMDMYPRTFIFGAKASAGYRRAKAIIKLINSVADVVNNDASIEGKIKVVFIENYRVSNAEIIFAAADVSEQISTASKEASGTGNMKFMLNGAPTLGTMDGANVEIVEEVGEENAFIFGLSSQEVIDFEHNNQYDPKEIYNMDSDIRAVLTQLIDGTYSPENLDLFREIYNSLLETNGYERADQYFILKDFRSYEAAQKKVEEAYRDEERWAKMAMLQTAKCGKFSSDRTIEEYAKEIWHLEKVTL